MHCCTRGTAPIQFRTYSTSSSREELTFGRWISRRLTPSVWRPGEDSAGCPPGHLRSRAVCRCRTVSGHDGQPQRGCLPGRQPLNAQAVAFTGDAWPGYVPMRMSDTKVFQERLPPGAAAVLISQSAHLRRIRDAPIDATEKRLFDAIDGDRPAPANIVGGTLSASERSAGPADGRRPRAGRRGRRQNTSGSPPRPCTVPVSPDGDVRTAAKKVGSMDSSTRRRRG